MQVSTETSNVSLNGGFLPDCKFPNKLRGLILIIIICPMSQAYCWLALTIKLTHFTNLCITTWLWLNSNVPASYSFGGSWHPWPHLLFLHISTWISHLGLFCMTNGQSSFIHQPIKATYIHSIQEEMPHHFAPKIKKMHEQVPTSLPGLRFENCLVGTAAFTIHSMIINA